MKALVITGQNYHPWKMTSEALKRPGLFQARYCRQPASKASMKALTPDFDAYRLVVLDYSGDDWPPSTRKAFIAYVKNGGGVVVYHSANNTFPEMAGYNETIGLRRMGRTDRQSPSIMSTGWPRVVRDTGPGVCLHENCLGRQSRRRPRGSARALDARER